jgi:hypothetical protein
MSIPSFQEKMFAAGNASGTDKVLIHRYEVIYSKHLECFASKGAFSMLEIGFGSGSGIQFWNSIFPNAFIYCFDRDPQDDVENGMVIQVDQSSLGELRRGAGQIQHPISLIVDDGSHHPSHQVLSFSYLFHELLDWNGVYIIEDIETSYWRNASLYLIR